MLPRRGYTAWVGERLPTRRKGHATKRWVTRERPQVDRVGLLAVSLGLSAHDATDDHAMLEHAMIVYDALYGWCRSLQDETHNWKPAS